MDNVWIAPVLGLIGVFAGAIVSGIIGERHGRKITAIIKQMLDNGSRHRDRIRLIEESEEHITSILSVCKSLVYKLSYLDSICTRILRNAVPDQLKLPDEIADIGGADLPSQLITTLANVRASIYVANHLRKESNAANWLTALETLHKKVTNAISQCTAQVVAMEERRDIEWKRAHPKADLREAERS